MFKKLMALGIAAVTAGLISGCAQVQVADDLSGQKLTTGTNKDVSHIYASNWGLYCVSIPLITGSTENPGSTVWMQDTVKVKPVVKMLTAKSKELGAERTLDIKSNANSTWIMPTFVLFIENVEVSGNAVK